MDSNDSPTTETIKAREENGFLEHPFIAHFNSDAVFGNLSRYGENVENSGFWVVRAKSKVGSVFGFERSSIATRSVEHGGHMFPMIDVYLHEEAARLIARHKNNYSKPIFVEMNELISFAEEYGAGFDVHYIKDEIEFRFHHQGDEKTLKEMTLPLPHGIVEAYFELTSSIAPIPTSGFDAVRTTEKISPLLTRIQIEEIQKAFAACPGNLDVDIYYINQFDVPTVVVDVTTPMHKNKGVLKAVNEVVSRCSARLDEMKIESFFMICDFEEPARKDRTKEPLAKPDVVRKVSNGYTKKPLVLPGLGTRDARLEGLPSIDELVRGPLVRPFYPKVKPE